MTEPSACPQCGAALRTAQPWCTLCYADLRPKPEPEHVPPPDPEPLAPVLPAPVVVDPLPTATDPATAPAPTWPCTACGTANSFDRDLCASCGQAFLAQVRDEAPLLELPVVGDLTKLSRAQRLSLAAGLVVAFLVLIVVIGLLAG